MLCKTLIPQRSRIGFLISLSLPLAYTMALQKQLNLPYLVKNYVNLLHNEELIKLYNTHTYLGLQRLHSHARTSNYMYQKLSINYKRLAVILRMEFPIIYMWEERIKIDPSDPCKSWHMD